MKERINKTEEIAKGDLIVPILRCRDVLSYIGSPFLIHTTQKVPAQYHKKIALKSLGATKNTLTHEQQKSAGKHPTLDDQRWHYLLMWGVKAVISESAPKWYDRTPSTGYANFMLI